MKTFRVLMALSGLVLAGHTASAQKFDTTGCSRFVYYEYDKFTEERELWSYDAVTLTNVEGMPSSPLAASSYKAAFYNNLSGRFLDKFAAHLVVSNLANNDGLLKSQVSSGVTVYLIFDGNKKFTFKAKMMPIETGYRIDLPMQGEVLMNYKTKKLTSMRISGASIGNVDFEVDDKKANHLLNELSCMFGYK
ncbi:MAG: hypothetical protein JNL72_08155 [Flavipsychrobacter sp.]|nr:hypothetical protein [Flavipsychrobacter sp.]